MTRLPLPAARPSAIRQTPTFSGHRCQLSVLGAAVALTLGVFSTDASALALGRLNVQSALGEPLRAEIDVTEISASEADGLKVNLASAEAFRAAGVPYNTVLMDMRVSLQRRANGRYVVRLTSNRQVSEPFIDLLLEASWNSGRIVRDYTVLLDPPGSRIAAAPIAPTAPQISAAPAPQRSAPAIAEAPALRSRPVPTPAAPAAVTPAPTIPAARPSTRIGIGPGAAVAIGPRAAVSSGAGAATGAADQHVTVQAGDTASKIASAYKTADVSLDQMLVALLRANPDAFIRGNVNRIKAGAVLDLPDASQASSVPSTEARRMVTAQSHDFTEYRRRLADNAPESSVADAGRQASGKLQANVEDRNAANAAADKLKVTQGGRAGATTAEDKLAQTRQAQESSARVAELSKNISDLSKLQSASSAASATSGSGASAAGATSAGAAPAVSTAGAGSAAPAASATSSATPTIVAPAMATSSPASAAAGTTPQAASATATAAPSATTPASAAEPKKTPVIAKPAAPAPAERGFFAELLDNPIMLGAAALIALLVAFLLYRVLGRKRPESGDSVFIESRIPRDSFFGASGGESVDTKNRGNSVVSSLSYSPSQLDAGDVDPVAEADVYLAYGRDLQAEEILREALRVNPERTAIHLKLLEIHAKRRDLRAYEALAADVHKLTGGTGSDWSRVAEMGRELDPGNPLYEAGSLGASAAETAAFAGTLATATAASAAPAATPAPIAPPVVEAPPPAFVPSVAPLDFDLDLTKPPTPTPAPVSASLPPVASDPFPSTVREVPRSQAASAPAPDAPLSAIAALHLENDFDTAPGALEAIPRTPSPEDEMTQPATLRAGLPGDSGFIEFDMSSLSGLSDRNASDTERARLEPLEESSESPHAIKLSLARELKALGDVEGARSLIEEVAAESSGDVKAEAKQLLGQLR
jgi:pilus assembly protein FimV